MWILNFLWVFTAIIQDFNSWIAREYEKFPLKAKLGLNITEFSNKCQIQLYLVLIQFSTLRNFVQITIIFLLDPKALSFLYIYTHMGCDSNPYYLKILTTLVWKALPILAMEQKNPEKFYIYNSVDDVNHFFKIMA